MSRKAREQYVNERLDLYNQNMKLFDVTQEQRYEQQAQQQLILLDEYLAENGIIGWQDMKYGAVTLDS